MTIVDPATGWFKIAKAQIFDLHKVTGGNDEYTDKLSSGVIQLFNNTWLIIYPRPHKFMFENGSEFKQYFTPLLNDFYIRLFYVALKNPKYNTLVEQLRKLIYIMLITKYLDNKLFYYMWNTIIYSMGDKGLLSL